MVILTAVVQLAVLASSVVTRCVHVNSTTTFRLRRACSPVVDKTERSLELKTITDSVTGQDKVDISTLTQCQVCLNHQEEVFHLAIAGVQTELVDVMNTTVECPTMLSALEDKVRHRALVYVTMALEADGVQLELDLFNRNKYS